MIRDGDRCWIINKVTGERFGSSPAQQSSEDSDLGYLSRRQDGNRVVVHVAGIRNSAPAE